jgi:geranylgeranyl diphosphate/geranylgeranyl-bacteriochlorophyllide a reductase
MYFGMQEWAEAGDQHPYFSAIFDPEITDYYCWTIPKENFLIIGAALLPQDQTSQKFERLKKKIRDYGIRFGKTVCREGAYILRPVTAGRPAAGTKGIALIGEAGGWISPSSSEGLSYAFRSALELAEVLRASPSDFEERFYARSRGLRRNIFLKNLKSRFIFHPVIRKLIMKTGLQSLDVFKA